MAGATLPTTWVPNHSPTAAEWSQVQNALKVATVFHPWPLFSTVSISSTGVWTNLFSSIVTRSKYGDGTGGTSGSDLLVFMAVSWFVAAPPAAAQLAITIDGTVYPICRAYMNDANVHHTMFGVTTVTGLAAGSHSFMPQIQRISGAGTVQSSVDDDGFWLTIELPH